MRTYILLPLLVSVVSLIAVWFVNRRGWISAALWPKGMGISGDVDRPDIAFDGELVLGCAQSFGTITCRSLRVAAGADVHATHVKAGSVQVDGRLRGVETLVAERRLDIRGELFADDVRSPRIRIEKRSRAVVLTVTGPSKIDRHPDAEVKGFFADLDEAMAVDYVRRLKSSNPPATAVSSEMLT